MSGRLSEDQMDQLESWIGTGPKTFTLLYSITRDGCVASTFHEKCDGQGPTVTVLYNPHGSVYGGYTSVSWSSPNLQTWSQDDKAFLFQLQFSGNKKLNKFPCTKQPQRAIYCHPSYGPTFGAGCDLHAFNSTVNVSNGVFSLNGHMNGFGNSYDTLDVKAGDVNNGTMNATELEVYKITDGQRPKQNVPPKPWRKVPDINEKFLDQLKEEIVNFKPVTDVGISEFRILMLGPVGSGKSSFYNTIDSIFRGRISHKAACGNDVHSTTTKFMPYSFRTRSGTELSFQLCDAPGFPDTFDQDVFEYTFALDGHLPDRYQFTNRTAFSFQNPDIVKTPDLNSRIHCVAVVLDASAIDDLTQQMIDKIKFFQKMINQREIPLCIILTKIDLVDTNISDNIGNAFTSVHVQKAVMKFSERFGIPPNRIFPVKNYHSEVHLDDQVSALALMALQQLLYMAEDYTEILSAATRRQERQGRGRAPSDAEVTESDTA